MEEGQPTSAIEIYRSQRRDSLTRAFLAQQQQRAAQATRQHPRARMALQLTLHWHDWETDLQTSEVSARGCSFFTSREPDQNDLRFSLQLPNGAVARGLGSIVACVARGDGYYVCVRFDAIQTGMDDELADAVLETLLSTGA